MFLSLAALAESCAVSSAEEMLLTGPAHPIMLLRRQGGNIAPSVAPKNPLLGAFLPYAPVHHLLLRAVEMPTVEDQSLPTRAKPLRGLPGSGDLGRHGMAIMAVREGFGFDPAIESDCALAAAYFVDACASGAVSGAIPVTRVCCDCG